MKNAARWILLAPLGLFLAYFFKDHPPSILDSHRWEDGLWGASGSLAYVAIKGMMYSLKEAQTKTPLEAKIFNEQLKLMATSLNAIALAFLAIAFVQPAANNLEFNLKDGALFVFGLFLHTRTYKILEYLRTDS
jgi:hypothetical protein